MALLKIPEKERAPRHLIYLGLINYPSAIQF